MQTLKQHPPPLQTLKVPYCRREGFQMCKCRQLDLPIRAWPSERREWIYRKGDSEYVRDDARRKQCTGF